MDDVRLIKKHANRRLYDTTLKEYISLTQIRDLICDGTDVRIEESGSGEDITRPILLQIMAECETNGRPLLSPSLLMTLIRTYGHPLQDVAGQYLENSLAYYMRQEARLRKRMTGMVESFDINKDRNWTPGKFGVDGFEKMRDNLMQALKKEK